MLTGPNNTSKTYVAHAIYGFCRELGSAYRSLHDLLSKELSTQTPGDADELTVELVRLAQAHLDFELEQARASAQKRLGAVFAADEDFVARGEGAAVADRLSA